MQAWLFTHFEARQRRGEGVRLADGLTVALVSALPARDATSFQECQGKGYRAKPLDNGRVAWQPVSVQAAGAVVYQDDTLVGCVDFEGVKDTGDGGKIAVEWPGELIQGV